MLERIPREAWPPRGHGPVVCLSQKFVRLLVGLCHPQLSGSITWMSLCYRRTSFLHKPHHDGQLFIDSCLRPRLRLGTWLLLLFLYAPLAPLAPGLYEDSEMTVVTSPSSTRSGTSFTYLLQALFSALDEYWVFLPSLYCPHSVLA